MDRPKPRRRVMRTQYLCLPLLKNTNTTAPNTETLISPSTTSTTATAATPSGRFSPGTSLLERFRDTVFRLIMLTALSKATNHDNPPNDRIRRPYNQNSPDPHHSEAVADCIEFFKKSSSSVGDHHPRDSTATTASVDSTAAGEVVFPVPVIM